MPTRDEATGAITLEVRGTAYYPDGVVIFLDVRHAKVVDYFDKEKTVVKNRTISHKLKPMTKAVPGGGIAIEAWFLLSAQTEAVKEQLHRDHWFRCDPPCEHDTKNVTHVTWSNGGWDAQAEAEKVEKGEIAKAQKDVLDAQAACQQVIDKIAAKEADPSIAAATLQKLEGDLRAAADGFNSWSKARQFLLFGMRVAQLRSLSSHVRECARAAAASAGASVPDFETAKAKRTVKQVSDELRGFLDEQDSLEREWGRRKADAITQYFKKNEDKCSPPPVK
jgi:hypothetical protein